MSVNRPKGENGDQPIRARYLGHVTGNQPISDQYSLLRSVHGDEIFTHNVRICTWPSLLPCHIIKQYFPCFLLLLLLLYFPVLGNGALIGFEYEGEHWAATVNLPFAVSLQILTKVSRSFTQFSPKFRGPSPNSHQSFAVPLPILTKVSRSLSMVVILSWLCCSLICSSDISRSRMFDSFSASSNA